MGSRDENIFSLLKDRDISSFTCQICASKAKLRCECCGAFFYCSPNHRQLHRRDDHSADHCKKTSLQLTRLSPILHHLLTHNLLLNPSPTSLQLFPNICAYLEHHHCHATTTTNGTNKDGITSSLCKCSPKTTTTTIPLHSHLSASSPPDTLKIDFNTMIDVLHQSGWIHNSDIISKESLLLRIFNPLLSPSSPSFLSGLTWETVRTVFPATSPSLSIPNEDASLLFLDWPLTVCSAILKYTQDINNKARISIHVVGVTREVEEWPILIAVLYHLILNKPHQGISSLDIYFIGTEVPRCVDNTGVTIHCPISTTTGGTNIEGDGTNTATKVMVPANVYFKRGLYQDVASNIVPSIVVGCNAGLAAYPEWLPALQHMFHSRSAGNDGDRVEYQLCLFTDYNEEAAERAGHMCRHVFNNNNTNNNHDTLAVDVSEVQVNPVLQPFLITPDDNALPTFSNGFRVWVSLYKDKGRREKREGA